MTEADLSAVKRRVETIVERLADQPTPSRAIVERGVILPILQVLGWDVFDTDAVQSRFGGRGANFDLALCDGQARPQLFLEIHGSRFDPGIVPGILSRARRAGVSLVVLTNGPAWRLYLAEAEADSAVPVFELKLSAADISESAGTLERYLRRARVLSGESLKDALASNALPAAWRALVTRKDSLLLQLLADEVRDRVGVKPADAAVVAFLGGLASTEPSRPVAARRRTPWRELVRDHMLKMGVPVSSEDLSRMLAENGIDVVASNLSARLSRAPEFTNLAPGSWYLASSPGTVSNEKTEDMPSEPVEGDPIQMSVDPTGEDESSDAAQSSDEDEQPAP